MASPFSELTTLSDWRSRLEAAGLVESWDEDRVKLTFHTGDQSSYPGSEFVNAFADFLEQPLEWTWNAGTGAWGATLDLSKSIRGEASPSGPKPPAGPTARAESPASPEPVVLRASTSVWRHQDDEGPVREGQQRPFLVLDEETVHLAATTRRLSIDDLLQRVRRIIAEQGVPVDVEAREVRWIRDASESRPRVVASLSDHLFSDIKVIMGVDYIGQWANLQQQLAYQPPEIPPAPPLPTAPNVHEPTNMAWAIVIGGIVLGLILMGNWAWLGWLLIAGSIVTGIIVNVIHQREMQDYRDRLAFHQRSLSEMRLAHRLRLAEREAAASAAFTVRTFKIDDMHLFWTAMQTVFKAVVDDILQAGGEVVRVDGGRGDFFSASGSARETIESGTPAENVLAAEDAAQAEV